MLLDQLRDFEWLNEPAEVNFSDGGMSVLALKGSDFWQNKNRHVRKDDGHFFFARKCGNFSLLVQWHLNHFVDLAQCGLMIRFNEQSWAKIALMSESQNIPKLGTFVCNGGFTDWACQNFAADVHDLWFMVKRINGDYIFFYSLDGIEFVQVRLFNFLNEDVEIKAGAFICSPKNDGFEAVLKKIDFE